jgi:hypothetical protein
MCELLCDHGYLIDQCERCLARKRIESLEHDNAELRRERDVAVNLANEMERKRDLQWQARESAEGEAKRLQSDLKGIQSAWVDAARYILTRWRLPSEAAQLLSIHLEAAEAALARGES